MKVDRLINDNGQFRCFEISNIIVSRTGMSRVISQLEGVVVTHRPKFYDDEFFCEFEFRGQRFEMSEPYGDSSVYDVTGPESTQTELETIASHFENVPPITGGDFPRNVYFLFSWLLKASFLTFIVYAIWRLTK
jgi:hypothetical protein